MISLASSASSASSTHSRVSMLIGGIVAGSSAIMYGIGNWFFNTRVRCLKNAPEIRDTSISGFGYLQGPLHTDTPITHDEKFYVRLDESIFHITTTQIIEYDLDNRKKRSDFKNKSEFVHRTAKQAKPITINNIDIGVFVKSISLKLVGSEFVPIGDYVPQHSGNGHTTNVNVGTLHSDNDHILGEHEKQVIGIEHRRSGIKAGKVYTIFGYFDANKQKMKTTDKYYNIITKQPRDDLIEHEESFSKGWKIMCKTGILVGTIIGGVSYVLNKT